MVHKVVRIAVVDTGIDDAYQQGAVIREAGVSFVGQKDGISCSRIHDYIGHGTGVTSLIHQVNPKAEIIPIQIYDEKHLESDSLYAALVYINEYVTCDIVHISLGVTCLSDITQLEAICEKIVEKGILIIAALDNLGMVSYPACFQCVIGVDSNPEWRNWNQYAIVENGEMDIIGCRREQRVSWLGGSTKMVSGSSFTAAYFSGVISQMIAQNEISTKKQVLEHLRENALRLIKVDTVPSFGMKFEIHKAITFPFNKEMHSLVRFRDLLSFECHHFYDVGYLGQIGKPLDHYDWHGENSQLLIENYDAIDWNDDFDTFILGHIQQLEKIVGRRYVEDIVEKCVKYNKKLYAFFDICSRISEQYKKLLTFDYPHIDSLSDRCLTLKTHNIGVPIVGVVGTESRQGKFTVQLALRNALLAKGYRVGQLGTEPSSLLFGMDQVYPMGYEGCIHVNDYDAVYMVNHLLGEIELTNPDIILFGTQGQIHMLCPGGYDHSSVANHAFLLGCQADGYILCVNKDDEDDDIEQTITYLQSIYRAHVLAMVLSPMARNTKWSIVNNTKNIIQSDVLIEHKAYLEKRFNLPVLIINGPAEAESLANICVKYFT